MPWWLGVDTGTVMRVANEGLPPQVKSGGSNGDLMLELTVQRHPLFRRNRFDVHQDLDVDFVDLILGCSTR